MYVLMKITFGTISILSTTERELSVWKKWFLKVARPPSSTGMRRPQERREMNTATGKDTSLRTDVTPAIVGHWREIQCLMQYLALLVFPHLGRQILNGCKGGPAPENWNLSLSGVKVAILYLIRQGLEN